MPVASTAHQPKVLFISTWINNPEFIPIQRDLIRKFCQESAELLVVLDGKTTPCFTNFGDTTIRQRQIDICRANNINFVEVPPNLHEEPQRRQLFQEGMEADMIYDISYRNTTMDPSSRTGTANQFGWRTFHQFLKPHYQYLVMIQSDVFPFAPFSVVEMLSGPEGPHSLLYKNQYRVSDDGKREINYAWDGFLMFNFGNDSLAEGPIPWNEWNFENGIQNGIFTDTGGGTWTILPKIQKKKDIDAKNSLQWTFQDPIVATLPSPVREFLQNDIRNEGEKIFSEIKHHFFIHLRGGGNWEFIKNPGEGLVIQEQRFQAFIRCCLKLLEQH